MKKFRIIKGSHEIKYKDRYQIREMCTYCEEASEPIERERFNTKEEAEQAFEKYKTSIVDYNKYYLIEECFLEEIEVDEDDEIIEVECLKCTNMIISVDRNYEELAIFDNLEDAENYLNDYEREHAEDDEEMIMMNKIKISFYHP